MDDEDGVASRWQRRSLLKLAGGAALAAAIAPWSRAARAAAGDEVPRAGQGVAQGIERLSAYMAEAGARELPADALEKTKHHILDTFGAMISGRQSRAGGRWSPGV